MRRPLSDRAFAFVLAPVAGVAALCPLFVAAFVANSAAPVLLAVGPQAFLGPGRWAPTSGEYALVPMVAGTLVSSALALGIAGPAALAYGLHVNLYAGRAFAGVARASVGVLAGIPSVLYGLVALTAVVPHLVRDHPPGLGLAVTAVTLAAMVLPTAAAGVDAAVHQVDPAGILAVRALGLGAWDAVRAVVLPSAAPGIRSAMLLGLGRALGETMAVLMVAGNTVAWPSGPFTTFRTLTGNVAVEMSYAEGLHRSALFATALLLLALVAALVALDARLTEGRA